MEWSTAVASPWWYDPAVQTRRSLSEIPSTPGLYALMGGHGNRSYIAYVGIAGKLRRRIAQHFVLRDSSVTTGTSATALNPDHVTAVRWWTTPEFKRQTALDAAEIIALEVLDPALRSRGNPTAAAKAQAAKAAFRMKITKLLESEPSGMVQVPTLQSALDRIEGLEERVSALGKSLRLSGAGRST
jgi:hypothetical protein